MQCEFEKGLFSNGPGDKGGIPVPVYLLKFICSTKSPLPGGEGQTLGLTSTHYPRVLSPS